MINDKKHETQENNVATEKWCFNVTTESPDWHHANSSQHKGTKKLTNAYCQQRSQFNGGVILYLSSLILSCPFLAELWRVRDDYASLSTLGVSIIDQWHEASRKINICYMKRVSGINNAEEVDSYYLILATLKVIEGSKHWKISARAWEKW